jgi:type IV secretion system coupling TraD/TrwB family protein
MPDPSVLPVGWKLGWYDSRVPFGIQQVDRRSHMWVLGASGTGKSSFIQGYLQADIQAGRGVGVIDPHGDLAEAVLRAVPPERVNDVVLLDMTDSAWPVALNVLQGAAQPEVIAASLVGAFKNHFGNSWGPRLEYCLYMCLAALSAAKNTSLLGVNRMLIDESYRAQVLGMVTDPSVASFWAHEFPTNDRDRREWVSSIQNKIGQFFGFPAIRNCLGQSSGRLFVRQIMDHNGIFIARIPRAVLGMSGTNLFGSLLVSLFETAALQREDTPEEDRVDFHLYIDEFQNFSSLTFAHALSEVRKYKLNMVLVNQYSQSLEREVLDAVLGNCATMVSFRVSGQDGELLSCAMADHIPATQFVNLARGQILVRLQEHGVQQIPFAGETFAPVPIDYGMSEVIREQSRATYARPRAQVEEQINRFYLRQAKARRNGG